jgi:voltage-gated potassium channel
VTATGQITAVFLMLVGIGLLGSVTATVASWIAERFQAQEDIEQLAILAELRAIREELAVLRAAAGVPAADTHTGGEDARLDAGIQTKSPPGTTAAGGPTSSDQA